MTTATPSLDLRPLLEQQATATECYSAGQRLAGSIATVKPRGPRLKRMKRDITRRILARGRAAAESSRAWLFDNARIIRTAEKEAIDPGLLHRYPTAFSDRAVLGPRVLVLAKSYLDHVANCYSEETCQAFVEGFQSRMPVEMGEIWGIKPALLLEILTRLESGSPEQWPALIASIQEIGKTSWKEFFESTCQVHRTLAEDPAGAYLRMDFESRDQYRNLVGGLSKQSDLSQIEVAAAAVKLALGRPGDDSQATRRQRHVGYFLLDKGVKELQRAIGFRPNVRQRLVSVILEHPTAFYLGGVVFLTLGIMTAILRHFSAASMWVAAVVLLLVPASQAAIDFLIHLVTYLARPRVLPKLDFSEGIPDDCTAVVAVPTLLLNEDQVRDQALQLEIRFLANRDPNLYFALLTDSPDSDAPGEESNGLIELCKRLIEGLNRRYPGSPFILLHRHRVYNDSEGRWMGWERKRGKLLDLNRVLRGGFDAFPVKVADTSMFERIKYVITLDADTQLPRESAAKLVGTLAHPLNRAVIDPVRKIVVEGYGILQPRIGISIQSSVRSRLAALYSGETGFDIYTRAISDVYQDLFGEGIFTGKGIYEVDAIRAVLERRFPENALLSHDLIEGAHARVALVSDIELIDDYPSHFSAYNRRKHRWVRGDWQILRWLHRRVPGFDRQMVPNAISLISRWKIMDNLRRSLIEPATLCLLLGGWLLLPEPAILWTGIAVAILFFPNYCDLLFSVLRMPLKRRAWPAWARDTVRVFGRGHAISAFSLTFLLHQSLLSLDAIVRSMMRVFITKRKLLEWETAAEAEAQSRSKATVDMYLEWTPWLSLALAALVWWLRPQALPAAAPVLALWGTSWAFSNWLNRSPRPGQRELSPEDREWLRETAEKTCRYFCDWSGDDTNRLIPDNVREDGAAALRLSPTNMGLMLDANIAALLLGCINLGDFVSRSREVLERLQAIPKCHGHLFNWYDLPSLRPLEPRFVSTVDSGNLAASLWTLKQAALAFAAEPAAQRGRTPAITATLSQIATACDDLVREMDFRFLYNPRKKLLSLGYDAAKQQVERTYYDLLASEARTAVFVAIAKGDIPQESWFHLGRAHTVSGGERTLLSWTGTMFEYLMPALWMRHYSGTILEQSSRGVVRIQRQHANRKGVPWGISESAAVGGGGGEYGYAPFGVPALALSPSSENSLVIAPYACALALSTDPVAAVQNLRRMESYGWTGRYGFYEAVDFTRTGGEIIRSWMAHHQGMILLAIANLLFDNAFQSYFHAEPQVMATELLLHERVPLAVVTEAEPLPMPANA